MLYKNITSQILKIYFNNKGVAKIILFASGVVAMCWLALAILLGFILNIDFLIKNSSPIPIRYSKQYVEYFLIPKIILKNVRFGNLESKEVKINIDLLSFFYFNPKMKNIVLLNSKSYYDQDNFNKILYHHKIINTLLKEQSTSCNIIFYDLHANFLGQNTHFKQLDIINSKDILSLQGRGFNDFNIFTELSKGDNAVFKLIVDTKEHKFNVVENYVQGMYKSGKLEFETKNIAKIFNQSNVHQSIAANNESKITADISLINDILEVSNIILTGKTLSGNAKLIFSDTVFNLEANLQELDTNNFIDLINMVYGLTHSNTNIDKIIPEKQDLGIHIKIANLLTANQKIQNFNFVMQGKDKNNLILEDFSGNLDDQGTFKIQGLITQNEYRSKFDGHVLASHLDLNKLLANFDVIEDEKQNLPLPFSLSSDLNLTNVAVSAQNLNATLGKSKINGDVAFGIFGDNIKLGSIIKATDLDTNDNLSLIRKMVEYFDGLFFDSYEEGYLNKFIPIRTNHLLTNLNLKFENLKYKGINFQKANFLVALWPSNVSLNSYTLLNNHIYLTGNALLDATSFQPIYKINIKDGKLAPISFNYLVDLKDQLQKRFNLANITTEIDVKFKNLGFMNANLENFELLAHSNSPILTIDKMIFECLGGSAFVNGSINTKPFLVNLGYAYNNLNLAPIFSNSFIMNNAQGIISTRGSLNFSGQNLAEMFYSLNVNGDLLGKDVIVQNLGIDGLLNNMLKNNYQQSDLAKDLDNFANNGSTKFNILKSQYVINTGIINLKNMEFSTDQSNGLLYGALDIYQQKVNLAGFFNFYLNRQSQNISQISLTIVDDMLNPKKTLKFNQNIPLSNLQ
jgi:hypothetical protein